MDAERLLREQDQALVAHAVQTVDPALTGSLLCLLAKRLTNAFWVSRLGPWLDLIPLRSNDLRNRNVGGAILRIKSVLQAYGDTVRVEALKGTVGVLLEASGLGEGEEVVEAMGSMDSADSVDSAGSGSDEGNQESEGFSASGSTSSTSSSISSDSAE